jgi:type VI secretion system secreted protein Hcp
MEEVMKRCAYFLVAGLVIGLFTFTLATEAEATDIFVCMRGIEGESKVMLKGCKEKGKPAGIHAESMSHQISQSGTMHVGGGGGSGKVQVGDIMLVKKIDKTTPKLNLLCSTGRHIPEVTILLTRRVGQQNRTYMEYTLKPVLVSSVSVEAAKGKFGTEVVTLNFAEIHWKYYPDHGDAVKKGWNIQKNTSAFYEPPKSSGQKQQQYKWQKAKTPPWQNIPKR